MGPMPNPLMPSAPQGQSQPTPQMTDAQIAQAHAQAQQMMDVLMELASKPKGQLTKQDAFQAAAGLLGKGLFDDPQSRAGLVAQLTQLPDDETALRQTIGREIMQVAQFKNALDVHAKMQAAMRAPPPGAPVPGAPAPGAGMPPGLAPPVMPGSQQ